MNIEVQDVEGFQWFRLLLVFGTLEPRSAGYYKQTEPLDVLLVPFWMPINI